MMTGWLSLPFRSPKLKEDLAVDDVPAGEFFILMPALLEIPTIKIMHLCIFFLFDRYVTLGIRFGSCFSNLSWLGSRRQ